MVTTKQPPTDPQPPSLSKFLYKTLLVLIVIFVVPLFPSRAPEFINQSLFTRGWELVHLLFVGIAVCYGLFSRRNHEEENQKGETLDGFETSVSRFLQESSSVFDDDRLETLDGDISNSGTSVQSWSSQYSRNAPVVVVAADDQISGAGNGTGESRGIVSRSMRTRVLGVNDKPLLLPVRSFKSARVFDSAQVDGSNMPTFRRSNSSRGGNEEEESNVVLRSPIPWRSRSGRMEMKEEAAESIDVSDEYVFRPVARSDQRRGIKSDSSTNSTPKSLSPSSSIDLTNTPRTSSGFTQLVSPELVAKEAEDGVRRKTVYKPSPPPAPPLPPPRYHKPESSGSDRSGNRNEMAPLKDFRHISSVEDSSRSVREEMMRRLNSRNSRSNIDNTLTVGKSVRTARPNESLSVHKALKEASTEGYWKDVLEAPKEPAKSVREPPESNQLIMSNMKSNQEMNIPQVTQGKEEKVVPEDIVTVESDCDSDSDSEDYDQVSETLSSFTKGDPQPVIQAMPSLDVDKKADEFIAKFREQIRLQRIESIKRSTYQEARKVT